MNSLIVIIISLLSILLVNGNQFNEFPPNFLFGASTSAYQIEGGWNEDGKGPSIWDEFAHKNPERIMDATNGDIGPDSYHLYKQDIVALKETGLNFYRFSISWSRILPRGDISIINEAGVAYYNQLIDELILNGIEPVVTMFHWDMPLPLHHLGGFTNPIISEYFNEYANLLFQRYGDRVKRWITFNEPFNSCLYGYGNGLLAPFIKASNIGAEYYCSHNLLIAHAKAYRLYKSVYSVVQNGKVGISLSSQFYYIKPTSESNSVDNNKAIVDRALQFHFGWFAHPIFSEIGGYPRIMIEEIANNSNIEGRPWSRLHKFDDETRKLVQGSADFLGLNYYTSRYVELGLSDKDKNLFWAKDSNLIESVNKSWPQAASKYIYSVPRGLSDLLKYIKDEYNNPEILITENGWSDSTGNLNDFARINYIGDHLTETLRAIIEYNCNVIGYSVWSLIDNFEWIFGYTPKFGIYQVNLTSPLKERTPRKSASFLRNVIRTRQLSHTDYNTDSLI